MLDRAIETQQTPAARVVYALKLNMYALKLNILCRQLRREYFARLRYVPAGEP